MLNHELYSDNKNANVSVNLRLFHCMLFDYLGTISIPILYKCHKILILHSVFSYMSSSLLIPDNLLNILDDHHVDSLYKVCRFCYIHLSPKDFPKKNSGD